MNRIIFSSQSVDWKTPEALYENLDREFHFTLDPCPIGGKDGLERSWKTERIYCNPPYGREIGKWLAKGKEADLAVFLLPARTDTKWFHEYALKSDEIRFVAGRLHFGGSKNAAPFPSVIVIFRNL